MMIGASRHKHSTACGFWAQAVLMLWLLWGVEASRAQSPLADSSAWEPLGDPLEILGFAFSGDPDEPLIWADGPGVWTIQDITVPWTEIDKFGPRRGSVFLFGPDFTTPDTIFAGSPLYRSTDGGQTFIQITAPTDPAGGTGLGSGNSGFDRAPPGSPYAWRFIASDPGSGDHISLLFSDDGGDSWTPADTTPPVQAWTLKTLRSGRVLAAGFYGAVRSDDGGVTWHHIPALYDTTQIRFDLLRMMVLPGFVTGQPGDSEEGRVVLSGTEGGANGGWYQWFSDDEGETWTRTLQPGNAGCGNGVDLVPLGSETGAPGDVAAVTCQGWVLLSHDGAETWTEIGRVPGVSSETNTIVKTAALGPDGRLYVGTSYLGPGFAYSYRSKWRARDGFAVASDRQPEAPILRLSVRPNPSRGSVELALSGADRQPVEVVIVDAQGREVARTELAPSSSWRLDVSGWAPGVYHARAGDGAAVAFTVVR